MKLFCQISVFVIPSKSFEIQENSIKSQNSAVFPLMLNSKIGIYIYISIYQHIYIFTSIYLYPYLHYGVDKGISENLCLKERGLNLHL